MHRDVAYLLDPRFPGGTSSAVAQELKVVSEILRPKVFGLTSRMFTGETASPKLDLVLEELGINLHWNPKAIVADVVIIHNPAFLKFEEALPFNIVARRVIVVTHENFLRPGGQLSYDIAATLEVIEKSTFTRERVIAPISPQNRKTVLSWMESTRAADAWIVMDEDWFNICEFELVSPTSGPTDRRGRLSRPGHEKFPPLEDLQRCFPQEAETNLILGADNLMPHTSAHPHWDLVPFGGMEVTDFFSQIDFMVYFTSSTWRESFGRVIAEAIAAGKVVLSDPETAASFGEGVVCATPTSVSRTIHQFIHEPNTYIDQVRKAQAVLEQYSSEHFIQRYSNALTTSEWTCQ